MTSVTLPFDESVALVGPPQTWPLRRTALEELAAVGWPTRRRENWRYTDIEPLAKAGFELAAHAPGRDELAAAGTFLGTESAPASRIVFIDGQHAPELDSGPTPGVEITALETAWGDFDSKFAGRITTADHPLASLNLGFTQRGVRVRVPAGAIVTDPLHIVFVGSARHSLAAQPRIALEIGEGASLAVVQHVTDLGDGAGWLNSVLQIEQAAGSRVDLYRLQRHHLERYHTSLLAADLGAETALRIGYVDLGGRLVRNDIDVRLLAPGARAEIFGVFLAGAHQHIDNHTRIDHVAGETWSDESFRGIAGENGRGVFNGKVIVRPNAQRIEARQSNDNLLLSDRAEIDAKPELEIYADDVKCSHGSTVGSIDADQLFYLRARGIDDRDARELLTAAFAATVLERIDNESVRTMIADCVSERLKAVTGALP